MNEEITPVLVACGQHTDRSADGSGQSPLEIITSACNAALDDAGSNKIAAAIDTIVASSLTVDADMVKTPLSGSYRNLPKSIANQLGISPKQLYYTATGGNTPQLMVNHFAREIAQGRANTVLLAGGEALRTMTRRFTHWTSLLKPKGSWKDKPGGRPLSIGDKRRETNKLETLYGLELPANTYPLFENALRAHYGFSHEEHRQHMGELFSRLSEVAAANEYAWFRQARSAEELATPTEENRYVAFPYTKLLTSMIYVNQAAAVLMTTAARARALGIAEDKWVYLHGAADSYEIWNVSERLNYYSSPALQQASQQALGQAGCGIDDIAFFDIYSCFPSAVQIACDEFGLAHDDPRGLSLTGGLPYFGGPGNNYSMHAIAEMIRRLRENPGKFGLLNANGWFLTKHSLGIYSTKAADPEWLLAKAPEHPPEVAFEQKPSVNPRPEGKARIETYTVIFDRDKGLQRSIIIGRLENDQRFLAETPSDAELLEELTQTEAIGRTGTVSSSGKKSLFVPD
ncbi:MAG: acetyl-CoA acetyltransferase [Pseudomonadota bacterium]